LFLIKQLAVFHLDKVRRLYPTDKEQNYIFWTNFNAET